MSRSLDQLRRRRAVTLVELLVALVVVAVCSTAVAILLSGASRTSLYVNTETQAMAEVENAYRRILHNLRTASALTTPTTVTPTNTLTLSTQPDASYGSTAATVTYSVSGGNLVETDSRYGTSTLVTGISTFSVTRVSTSSPTQITVTLISGTNPPVKRSATVTCRNF